MTAYTAIADADIDPESPITTTLVTRLRDNPIAISEGTSPAPAIANAALTGHPWGQADIADDAIGQGELITSLPAAVTTTSASLVNLTLPGGSYGFYPSVRSTAAGTIITGQIASGANSTSFVTNIALLNSGGSTTHAQQRYVTASGPYDLRDGVISMFLFAEVTPSAEILSAYCAREAPWHYNGPTDIRGKLRPDGKKYRKRRDMADYFETLKQASESGDAGRVQAYLDAFAAADEYDEEITQTIKNADMAIVPHPFASLNPANTPIIIDPVSPILERLYQRAKHDGLLILDLLHDGYLVIGNTEITNRAGPPNVAVHPLKWKNTRS